MNICFNKYLSSLIIDCPKNQFSSCTPHYIDTDSSSYFKDDSMPAKLFVKLDSFYVFFEKNPHFYGIIVTQISAAKYCN